MSDTTVETFKHALSVARKLGFAEVDIEMGEASFEAKLEPAKARPQVARSVDESSPDGGLPEAPLPEILSTLVGYYGPSSPPLAVGRKVAKGDVVAVISALGLANDIESALSGEVVEVLVIEGDPVEYGQPLARLTA
jgi:acetyl-CoA carboxylase biotin carboxyl carrier protein